MKAGFGIIELPRSIQSAIENAQVAEQVGFDWIGVADSQSLFRELFVTLAILGEKTSKLMIGPSVTNPLTRHPAVMASASATLQEITRGRAMLGIGTGDSAIYNINQSPQGLEGLRQYILAVRNLIQGRTTVFRGREIHAKWISGQVEQAPPIYISAEGPKTLELAGEIADGVICGMGISPDVIKLSLEHIEIGAKKSGRTLDDIDIWTLARVNIGNDRAALIQEIRMELASTAHHAFRFTQAGKLIPPELADAIRNVQVSYQPAHHEDLGPSPNAQLMDNPELLTYMVERFAVIGSVEECVERIQAIRSSGIHKFLFTGFVEKRVELIKTLGNRVFPKCRN